MIKFNQPRHILPLIVLPFIYVFFYMYQTSFGKEQNENVLTETSAINPGLPDPFLNENDFKNKFDSFLEAHKNKRDHSAMREIDRREEEIQILDTVSIAPLPVSVDKAYSSLDNKHLLQRAGIPQRRYTKKSVPAQHKPSDHEKQMQLFKAQMNYMDSLFGDKESPKSPARPAPAGRRSGEVGSPEFEVFTLGKPSETDGSVDVMGQISMEKENPMKVEKKGSPSASLRRLKEIQTGHFNTIIKDKTGFFIKAIIDEELKVSKESRIRIRLLEDVVIGDKQIPKGKYLYGVVSSFKPQRVEVHISSMLLGDQIIEISLDIYDMDGMKGLYVPESKFRELTKSMGSDMASGQQLNIENSPDNQMQLMYGLAKDAFNTTSRTAAKAIRKNKARLKYNTMVYLVNNQNTSSNNQLTL